MLPVSVCLFIKDTATDVGFHMDWFGTRKEQVVWFGLHLFLCPRRVKATEELSDIPSLCC